MRDTTLRLRTRLHAAPRISAMGPSEPFNCPVASIVFKEYIDDEYLSRAYRISSWCRNNRSNRRASCGQVNYLRFEHATVHGLRDCLDDFA
jgi:hypothetical protein